MSDLPRPRAADEIRELLRAATPGPWKPDDWYVTRADPANAGVVGEAQTPEDAVFIAAAPDIAAWALNLYEAALDTYNRTEVLVWCDCGDCDRCDLQDAAGGLSIALAAPLRPEEPK